ncbi:hypothetical protein AcW1_009211 [Taiwanofungus camphoratus]|nr:hypothetical protein AcW1_009211 [Antrodia cinnamomea]
MLPGTWKWLALSFFFYDHSLTFADEVSLIWCAPASFVKYTFLFNRYLVLGTLIAVASEMCGFVGDLFTDLGSVHERILYTFTFLKSL